MCRSDEISNIGSVWTRKHQIYRKIYEWTEKLEAGRIKATHKCLHGRPSTSHAQVHLDMIDVLVREDQQITVFKLAEDPKTTDLRPTNSEQWKIYDVIDRVHF